MIIETKKLSELNPAPYNPRKSNEKQEAHLKASLEKFGAVEPIIFNKQTGYIVGGHFRVRELKKLGYKEIDCVIVDLNEQDEKELNIRLNANTGDWDFEDLATNWDVEELAEWGLDVPDKIVVDGKEIEINEDFEPAEELGIEKEYLMIIFETKEQHENAIQFFNLKTQREVNNKKIEMNNIGIQRVIKYEDLRTIIK